MTVATMAAGMRPPNDTYEAESAHQHTFRLDVTCVYGTSWGNTYLDEVRKLNILSLRSVGRCGGQKSVRWRQAESSRI